MEEFYGKLYINKAEKNVKLLLYYNRCVKDATAKEKRATNQLCLCKWGRSQGQRGTARQKGIHEFISSTNIYCLLCSRCLRTNQEQSLHL